MIERSFAIRETRLRRLYRLLTPTTDPKDVVEGYKTSLASEITTISAATEDSMIFETGYWRQPTLSANPEHDIEVDEQSSTPESNTSAATEDSAEHIIKGDEQSPTPESNPSGTIEDSTEHIIEGDESNTSTATEDSAEHIIEGDEQSPTPESNTSAVTEDSADLRAGPKLGFGLLPSAFAWMQNLLPAVET